MDISLASRNTYFGLRCDGIVNNLDINVDTIASYQQRRWRRWYPCWFEGGGGIVTLRDDHYQSRGQYIALDYRVAVPGPADNNKHVYTGALNRW